MSLRCPDCGLSARYFVGGKWTTIEKIRTSRYDPGNISLRPQHRRWCRTGRLAYCERQQSLLIDVRTLTTSP